jgi:hypothetical protein
MRAGQADLAQYRQRHSVTWHAFSSSERGPLGAFLLTLDCVDISVRPRVVEDKFSNMVLLYDSGMLKQGRRES